MSGPVVVINPNSSEQVTRAIDGAVEPLRMAGGPEIDCVTLAEGPAAIESQNDVESVVLPLCRYIGGRNDAAAFVIACFSDPGLHAARESSARPVFGIAESGYLTALTLGERFGVISILAGSVRRHLRHIRALGLDSRLAADLPLGVGVAGLADVDAVEDRMIAVGRKLRDEHGADVVVMGCAGMAGFRQPMEESLDIPVIEPTQAATVMAMGAARLGLRTSGPQPTGAEG